MRKEGFGEFDTEEILKVTGAEKTTNIPPKRFFRSESRKDAKANIALSYIEENAVESQDNQQLEATLRIKENGLL